MNQPTLSDRTSAAEQIGARIHAVTNEEVRGVLWAAYVLALHCTEAGQGTRYVLFTRKLVPLLNRLGDQAHLRPDSFVPRLPQLDHTIPEVPAIGWALRHLAFGANDDALAALEDAA